MKEQYYEIMFLGTLTTQLCVAGFYSLFFATDYARTFMAATGLPVWIQQREYPAFLD